MMFCYLYIKNEVAQNVMFSKVRICISLAVVKRTFKENPVRRIEFQRIFRIKKCKFLVITKCPTRKNSVVCRNHADTHNKLVFISVSPQKLETQKGSHEQKGAFLSKTLNSKVIHQSCLYTKCSPHFAKASQLNYKQSNIICSGFNGVGEGISFST